MQIVQASSILLAVLCASIDCARADESAQPARPSFDALQQGLVVDAHAPGAVAVFAPSYKAIFDEQGASFVPFLGADGASRELRTRLVAATIGGRPIAVDSAAAARREGGSVVHERGLVDEVYELSLDHVEQTFVVDHHPGAGDLRLRVALESGLAEGAATGGLSFVDERGEGVSYGSASVRNADGTLTAVPTLRVDGGVEIVVPQALLDAAAYPLVVDPVIHSLAIENGAAFATEADAAYDLLTNTWTVVYQVERSATDRDAYCRIYDAATMTLRGERVIDASLDDVSKPKIANSRAGSRHLVVAQRSLAGGSTSQIAGWFVYPSNMVVSAPGTIASTTSIPGAGCFNPDVGGSSGTSSTGAQFCVVYTAVLSDFQQSIYASRLTLAGAPLAAPQVVDNTIDAWNDRPAISSVSDGQGWAMAWERQGWGSTGWYGRDVYGAQLTVAGVRTGPTRITAASADGASSLYDSVSVCVLPRSGTTMRWFVAYSRYTLLNPDVELVSLNNTTTRHRQFLHTLRGAATSLQEAQPALANAGTSQIAVAWTSTTSTLVAPAAMYARVPIGSTGLFGTPDNVTAVSPAGQACVDPCLGSRLENGATGNADFLEAWTVRGAGDIHAVQFRAL